MILKKEIDQNRYSNSNGINEFDIIQKKAYSIIIETYFIYE